MQQAESQALDPSGLRRLRQLFAARPDIVAAWLFGSRARGAGRPDSDIDLAVWFREQGGAASLLDRRLDVAVACANTLGVPIERVDLVAISEAGPLLLHAVLRDGVLLKDDDPTARVALQVDALNRYVEASCLRGEAMRERAKRLGGAAMTPLDRRILDTRLERIERECAALERVAASGLAQFLADEALTLATERRIQIAVQAAIDIASHVTAAQGSRSPETYRETFAELAALAVIDDRLAARMQRAAGLRNILVHGYLEVDAQQVHATLREDVNDLRAFVAAISGWLTRSA